MLLLTLIKLQFLKAVRSVSLGRRLIGGFFLALIGFILLSNIVLAGILLQDIIAIVAGGQSVLEIINTYLIFYFSFEIFWRFFIQKTSAIELQQYLHLPIGRSTIIHFMLGSSFISVLNIIPLLLFGPYAITELSASHGSFGAVCWLLTVSGVSWSLHWMMMGFKQKYEDHLPAVVLLFGLLILGISLAYYQIFNMGSIIAPFFELALTSFLPPVVVLIILSLAYLGVYRYYQQHAYIEALGSHQESRSMQRTFSLFDQFGLAGIMANLELKLILRNKRSRGLLLFIPFALIYALLYYSGFFTDMGNFFDIVVGLIISGTFILNYGQLFISWNAAFLDFYLTREQGIYELVKGKYLILSSLSLVPFLLSIPFIYFGWHILWINTVTFLFNIGINIPLITSIALWKPKPIDISQRSMYNFEGMGAAQHLMAIPMLLFPSLIYLPFAWWINNTTGLAMLGVIGLLGIIFQNKIRTLQANYLVRSKYNIGSSFRREL
jgi:hypothetical protein